MREVKSNVIHVRFRKQEPKRAKRQGLALTFRAGDGYVFIAASGRQRFDIKAINELIRDLRDVRGDAKARRRG